MRVCVVEKLENIGGWMRGASGEVEWLGRGGKEEG